MGFESLEEVFDYIESFTNLEKSRAFSARTYRLDRMQGLLEQFENPQRAYRVIHLAGTKGKGSTAALLAWSLADTGVATGLYTSPHVERYTERMTLLGRPPEEDRLCILAEGIREVVESPPAALAEYGRPTTFELLTLLAFLYFREAGCRIAVVETGIGGRLDATNLVHPELCLITPVELEHTDVLGDSLESIAREKGGIIKPGVPVLCASQPSPVRRVLEEIARERGSSIAFLDDELETLEVSLSPQGTKVRLKLAGDAPRSFALAMLGRVQAENAALAWLALRRLGVPPASARRGFAMARLPGRLERIGSRPPVVLDGAHTPRSCRRLVEDFRQIFGGQGVLLFGAITGKRVAEMAEVLAPSFSTIILTAPGAFKESDLEGTLRSFSSLAPNCALIPDTAEALGAALEASGGRRPVLVTGSFYLAGAVRRLLVEGSGSTSAGGGA